MPRHYLDHASTSPLRPEALEAMAAWLRRADAGDPSRIHAEGHASRVAIETARDQVAALVGARPREVVFTSGATEAIAYAVFGATERGDHVVVPAIEHSAVRLASERHEVTVVGCDALGHVDAAEVIGSIRPDTALVHLQWGNHEVGTLQPVAEVVTACRDRGVLVHVDAAQAAGHLPVAFTDLGADLMSVSAHKMGGPPGVGALLVRRGVRLRSLLVGGDQERARRAGLENAPAIVGWGAAAEASAADPGRRGGREPSPDRARPGRRRRPCRASRSTATRSSGWPTSSASASRASSPRRCCSASTRPASPPTRAAPAPRRT